MLPSFWSSVGGPKELWWLLVPLRWLLHYCKEFVVLWVLVLCCLPELSYLAATVNLPCSFADFWHQALRSPRQFLFSFLLGYSRLSATVLLVFNCFRFGCPDQLHHFGSCYDVLFQLFLYLLLSHVLIYSSYVRWSSWWSFWFSSIPFTFPSECCCVPPVFFFVSTYTYLSGRWWSILSSFLLLFLLT